jgi:hypothetical protein
VEELQAADDSQPEDELIRLQEWLSHGEDGVSEQISKIETVFESAKRASSALDLELENWRWKGFAADF